MRRAGNADRLAPPPTPPPGPLVRAPFATEADELERVSLPRNHGPGDARTRGRASRGSRTGPDDEDYCYKAPSSSGGASLYARPARSGQEQAMVARPGSRGGRSASFAEDEPLYRQPRERVARDGPEPAQTREERLRERQARRTAVPTPSQSTSSMGSSRRVSALRRSVIDVRRRGDGEEVEEGSPEGGVRWREEEEEEEEEPERAPSRASSRAERRREEKAGGAPWFPFGKGGGGAGAPLRDEEGEAVADLKGLRGRSITRHDEEEDPDESLLRTRSARRYRADLQRQIREKQERAARQKQEEREDDARRERQLADEQRAIAARAAAEKVRPLRPGRPAPPRPPDRPAGAGGGRQPTGGGSGAGGEAGAFVAAAAGTRRGGARRRSGRARGEERERGPARGAHAATRATPEDREEEEEEEEEERGRGRGGRGGAGRGRGGSEAVALRRKLERLERAFWDERDAERAMPVRLRPPHPRHRLGARGGRHRAVERQRRGGVT
eukprot:tig00021432_g21248.t1